MPRFFRFLLPLAGACLAQTPAELRMLHATLSEPGGHWVNPARLAETSEPGLGFGMTAFEDFREAWTVGRFPGRFALGYEYDVESISDFPTEQTLFAQGLTFAKQGLGPGWADRLSLGLGIRYMEFQEVEYYSSGWSGEKFRFAVDGGLTWTTTHSPRFGRWAMGAFLVRSPANPEAGYLVGAQTEWDSPTGAWELSGLHPLNNWVYADADAYLQSRTRLMAGTLAFLYRPAPWLGIGGEFTVAETSALKAVSEPVLPGVFRQMRLGLAWGVFSRQRSYLRGSLEVRFTGRKTAAGRARPANSALVIDSTDGAAAQVPPDTSGAAAREAYARERIGVFRGVVWPYLNTFGYFTTLAYPAGTSSLAVGNTRPGFALLLGWGGLAVSSMAVSLLSEEENGSDIDPGFLVYLGGQSVLKLIDLYLSQRHVRRHNRELREKYRIGIRPSTDGGEVLVSLDY